MKKEISVKKKNSDLVNVQTSSVDDEDTPEILKEAVNKIPNIKI